MPICAVSMASFWQGLVWARVKELLPPRFSLESPGGEETRRSHEGSIYHFTSTRTVLESREKE